MLGEVIVLSRIGHPNIVRVFDAVLHDLAQNSTILQEKLHPVCMHKMNAGSTVCNTRKNAGQLLAQLQSSEHDKFAAHLYRSRREYRLACDHSGKSGKQIERCLISAFKVAESMVYKGDYRQWRSYCGSGTEIRRNGSSCVF
jgi:hypothetical protein